LNEREISESSLSSIAESIRQERVSPVELIEVLFKRIERIDGKLNSYVTLLKNEALKEAKDVEKQLKRGLYKGPLHGIPFAVKDVFATKGVRTTAGCRLFADFIPDYDATPVERLKSSGAILLGKLNTHELALGGLTDNKLFGQTKNAWDVQRITGGSSGGPATALAASLCFASLGTDGGGSIRIPAALCGVTGFKPTYGRVSRFGLVPVHWSLEHVGPIAKTAKDAAIILTAIAGQDPKDYSTSSDAVPDYTASLSGDLEGVRVGYISQYSGEAADEEVDRSFRNALHVFEQLGASVTEVSIPVLRSGNIIRQIIIASEAACLLWDKVKVRASEIDRIARRYLEFGALTLTTEYLKAQQLRSVFIQEIGKVFKKYDILLSPTTPATAARIDEKSITLRGKREDDFNDVFSRFNGAYNIAGLPSISTPCGFDSKGLPIGLQIAGKAFDDALVLNAAYTYQRKTNFESRVPNL